MGTFILFLLLCAAAVWLFLKFGAVIDWITRKDIERDKRNERNR